MGTRKAPAPAPDSPKPTPPPAPPPKATASSLAAYRVDKGESQRLSSWFIFGEQDGLADVTDCDGDVFSGLDKAQARAAVFVRDQFLDGLGKVLGGTAAAEGPHGNHPGLSGFPMPGRKIPKPEPPPLRDVQERPLAESVRDWIGLTEDLAAKVEALDEDPAIRDGRTVPPAGGPVREEGR